MNLKAAALSLPLLLLAACQGTSDPSTGSKDASVKTAFTSRHFLPISNRTGKSNPSTDKPADQNLIDGKYVVKSTHHGKMSWYSVKTNGGTRTASGERLTDSGLTAAHRTLKFGTRVRVTNTHNGKTAIVRITDRGPYIRGRIVDVSMGAARQLDFVGRGVANCKIEVLGTP